MGRQMGAQVRSEQRKRGQIKDCASTGSILWEKCIAAFGKLSQTNKGGMQKGNASYL